MASPDRNTLTTCVSLILMAMLSPHRCPHSCAQLHVLGRDNLTATIIIVVMIVTVAVGFFSDTGEERGEY